MSVFRLPVLSEDLPQRPRTRAYCADVPRPCPWVGCRYNTFLDVDERGRLRVNGNDEPEDRDPRLSCALDVADDGGASLREVGRILSMTREGARQLEQRGLARVQRRLGELAEEQTPKVDRPPTISRDYRRPPRQHEAPDDEDDVRPPSEELLRVSFFASDEDAVLDHVWRIYARAIGLDLRSIFSIAATRWREQHPGRAWQLGRPKTAEPRAPADTDPKEQP